MTVDYDDVRTAARVILIAPDDRELLLGARDPADRKIVWFVPGGGVEAGESLEQAAVRELAEEVPQAAGVDLRGPVWTRQLEFSWNGRPARQGAKKQADGEPMTERVAVPISASGKRD